ncbi:lysine--tRNA ligase [Desulfosoma caldarium]|uniref:Lysine--tRNA ligase n=1 Tax=Desulfosoma caldarium TaxID=610254 RepID=A0A3N1UY84_9BACT|nr:lysine--tRNA ligase [Desulfosoma caldarium]ROQ92236.1 lysyl-tRNA synthetase class II [Desulfosoma caldarium]
MEELSQVLRERLAKAEQMEREGICLYPNGYTVDHAIGSIVNDFGHKSQEELESDPPAPFLVAGRIMALRSFGRSIFMHIQDGSGRIQVYCQQNTLGKDAYALVKKLDLGDIIRVRGTLFRTKTKELTLLAQDVVLLTKNLRPLPEKYHGLKDVETRYRQRYVDLIVNPSVRDTFVKRTQIVQAVRQFLSSRGFLEVETPMMQIIPGGATAKPFKTFHNALGIDLYLRIAPELYLKRLLVGGFERVFELNRNFRNEGISTQHNPEFTMLEFYQAYATFEDLITLTEQLFVHVAQQVNGGRLQVTYQGATIDLTPPWRRFRLSEALTEIGQIPPEAVHDPDATANVARSLNLPVEKYEGHGKLLTKIFDLVVEPKLVQPTFITHYPLEVSPLSRKNDREPHLTDRFELFIAGREMANAFSELNDPRDQRERFRRQLEAREAGDEEAHLMDEDYIRALEYGMPPAAGEGIGIDRMVMLFTDSPSIRDVILFPHLRPEKKQ